MSTSSRPTRKAAVDANESMRLQNQHRGGVADNAIGMWTNENLFATALSAILRNEHYGTANLAEALSATSGFYGFEPVGVFVDDLILAGTQECVQWFRVERTLSLLHLR